MEVNPETNVEQMEVDLNSDHPIFNTMIFIAHMQANYVNEAKKILGTNECLVFADFSEIIAVCARMLFKHFTRIRCRQQFTLCYYRDRSGNVLSKSYLVISE